MLIYNVTAKVDWTITEQWLEWLLEQYLPAVVQTGCFARYQFVRLLDIDETEGPTFAIQYYADTEADYQRYVNQYRATHQKETAALWGEKCLTFATLMEVVK